MTIFAVKDTEFYCKGCGCLYMVLSKDVYNGTPMLLSAIRNDKGQAPFAKGEPIKCKVCFLSLIFQNLIAKAPQAA